MKTWSIGLVMALGLLAACDEPGGSPLPPPHTHDAGPSVFHSNDMFVPRNTPAYPGTPEHVVAPTAIGGAALHRTADGRTAVATDPARDRIYLTLADLSGSVTTIDLDSGDEPGPIVEDANGRIHVALRRGGALVTLTEERNALAERRPVCPAPRGVAYDAGADAVLVACAGGELVTLPAAGGAELDRVFVASDLRDVIVTDAATYVTRFRSAELLTLDDDGAIVERRAPLSATIAARPEPTSILPNVAYRTLALPDGDLIMLHQRSVSSAINVDPATGGGYGGGMLDCATSVVQTSMTRFPPTGIEGLRAGPVLHGVALAVDMTLIGGDRLAITSAGWQAERLHVYPVSAAVASSPSDCLGPVAVAPGGDAVAADGDSVLIVRREPALLARWSEEAFDEIDQIWLDSERSIANQGHEKFHQVTGTGIACASCHPEGGEDGHTWVFEGVDPRRTQTLLGGILSTAPFHWSGDQPDLAAIMTATFEERMRGGPVSPIEVDRIGEWMDAQPALPAPETDPVAAAAGEEVFIGAGCADCHSGELGTNNESVELADFGAIQVPMLVGVAHRSPWLHDGCAQSLEETFDGACIPEHVPATAIDETQTQALVDYLRSL